MPTLAAVVKDLQEQWDLLRAWLEELPDPASPEPSTLPGWSIGVLVAHLGRNMDAISALRPVAPDDGDPLTLAEYLATYAAADHGYFDGIARDFAASIADDPLEHLDRLADLAFAHIAELAGADGQSDTVVVARRGTIGLRDFLVSRLIELVVHGYDLAPTLPLPAPIDPTARTIVAEALIEVARQRSGYAIDVDDQAAWIAAATGRLDWPAAVARGAVRPSALSDGTPDLTASLPLL
ncbi:maleylpyruvate isomerase N-terminal domain-containing protein [Pseudactinotalea suaedae]|uniref:maleylpyruvate isomerase N-terminal domain-containing protein n=1 Tax=Pseudactinotalea suaedae TaxID=1524924 RepID=UPI0012E21522|nr:maleylpyruvate isomerase N-terminal domain-containing protein [Pseudactinotalea suaedae]